MHNLATPSTQKARETEMRVQDKEVALLLAWQDGAGLLCGPLYVPRYNRCRPCPGGTADNSPTLQRWVSRARRARVPKGRPRGRAGFGRPFGTCFLTAALPHAEALGYCRLSLRDKHPGSSKLARLNGATPMSNAPKKPCGSRSPSGALPERAGNRFRIVRTQPAEMAGVFLGSGLTGGKSLLRVQGAT